MHDPGLPRQLLLVVLVAVGSAAATRFLASILAADGLSLAEIGILVVFALTFTWISLAFWTAIAGFALLAAGSGVAGRISPGFHRPRSDAPLWAKTALIVPVFHEDPEGVGARLAATWRSLERTGELDRFDVFILSDSRKPEVAHAEEVMWARLCSELGAAGRLFYRRRTDNRGRKSGNVADFCRRWGRRYDFFVVLDADSLMSGATLVRLVRLMQANPRAGLIQTAPQPIRGVTLFARIVQFATRLYGGLYVTGAAFWFPGKSSYWGHNAIIRTEAFTACCGLPPLPGRPPLGGEILSHDFVEAALLRRAGWGVWLEPDLGGSYEELPPTLGDYATRDRRWCQGNLQHARLLGVRGFSVLSRVQLALGVMSYLASPLWFLLLLLASFQAAYHDPTDWVYFQDAGSLFPVWPVPRAVELIGLFGVTLAILLLPKLLALLLALADAGRRRGFGGGWRLVRSTLAEIVFAALLAPVLMVQQTSAVIDTLLGGQVGWSGQNRGGSVVGWRDAGRRYAATTVLGLVWGVGSWWLTPALFVWLTPVLAGLVFSVPLAWLSGDVGLGGRARRDGWFLVPEETATPPEIAELPGPATAPAAAPAGTVGVLARAS